MEYANIDGIRNVHLAGSFSPEEQITVDGVVYKRRASTTRSLHETIKQRSNCAVLYVAEDDSSSLAVVWGVNSHQQLVPANVVEISPITEQENRIGDTVAVEIMNIPTAKTLRATVDTGATYSTLHADKWQVKGDQVHFVSKPLSDNVIRMPLETQQAVKSPGDDVEYRPVVRFNIKINGEVINDQLFNLSDRADMDNPILLGQNTLEDGNFIIDPRMNEEQDVDWSMIEEQINSVPAPEQTGTPSTLTDDENARAVYETLKNANVTLEDVFRVARADALKVMEEISY